MEFMVRLEANLPADMPQDEIERLYTTERATSTQLVRHGVIKRLWRIQGTAKGVLLIEAANEEELKDVLTSLPLYPFCVAEVDSLIEHPVEAQVRNEQALRDAQ